MIAGIASLLSAQVLGGVLGLLKAWLSYRSQERQEKAGHERNMWLAQSDHGRKVLEILNAPPQEIELDAGKNVKIKLGSWIYEYSKSSKKEKLVYGLASLAHNFVLCVLAFGVVIPILIWADNPAETVRTFVPGQDGTNVKILFGLFDVAVSPKEAAVLTTGGLAFILLHPLVAILQYVLTGAVTKRS